MPLRSNFLRISFAIAVAVVLHGCSRIQPVLLGKKHPHEEYQENLQKAGLERTALAQAWIAASEKALRDPVTVTTPFQEAGYFPRAFLAMGVMAESESMKAWMFSLPVELR